MLRVIVPEDVIGMVSEEYRADVPRALELSEEEMDLITSASSHICATKLLMDLAGCDLWVAAEMAQRLMDGTAQTEVGRLSKGLTKGSSPSKSL